MAERAGWDNEDDFEEAVTLDEVVDRVMFEMDVRVTIALLPSAHDWRGDDTL